MVGCRRLGSPLPPPRHQGSHRPSGTPQRRYRTTAAGFIVYLLRDGYAQRLAEAWRRARQRPRPPRKPPDEPDWDAIVAALREALAPYGIRVDDEGRAVLPTYLLPLPPDPDEAVALLWRHGFLRGRNGQDTDQDADQDPADAPDQAPTDADALTDDAPTTPTRPKPFGLPMTPMMATMPLPTH
jgi:hypothetical protein